MAVKVAINGFGRIGRLAFRQMFGAEGYEIVAINDLTSPSMLAHLLKYDSTQGRYALCDKVTAGEDSITVDGKEIKIYAKANAEELLAQSYSITWLSRAQPQQSCFMQALCFVQSVLRRVACVSIIRLVPSA